MKMLLLAAPPTGEAAKAGPWGFAVLLLLAIAFYFLFKSMSRHLRKVRDQFPTDEPRPANTAAAAETPEPETPAAAGTSGAGEAATVRHKGKNRTRAR